MLHRPNSSTSQTRPASRLLKDHWYVGCPSSQLTTSAPRAAQIGEFNLVLFRDAASRPRALLDRCSHRGVRLSLGRVTEGRIACGYHGWEFDADGELRHVPSLTAGDKVPVCSVPAFPVVERDFYVWVWIAGQSPAPTYEPQLIGIGERNWIQETAIWDVNVIDAVENALDVAHTPFLHPGIYPGHRSEEGIIPPLHQFTVECCVVDGGVELHIPPGRRAFLNPAPGNNSVSGRDSSCLTATTCSCCGAERSQSSTGRPWQMEVAGWISWGPLMPSAIGLERRQRRYSGRKN